MKRLRNHFGMSNESEQTPVQDNVIFVPFNLQTEIFTVAKAGGDSGVLGAATGCEPWVVDTIVKFRKRKAAAERWSSDKEPA